MRLPNLEVGWPCAAGLEVGGLGAAGVELVLVEVVALQVVYELLQDQPLWATICFLRVHPLIQPCLHLQVMV